ncbi:MULTISPECIES: VOC family protein [Rhizobium]|uniref:Catechol 2,3-dioxygenase-like lactoylglutathione lyase family enzyme n=1 Tax=Rhizobium tropici TaxID=398 RepID=A0A6P1CDB9_RHITR|nr:MULTISPECIES: VOC family protein [Rhizobium]AGB73922.1 glyoxalase family protein [Rhizobium tropici CIAT 899]MBB4245387.1 catechol 2,3-dioxygenase-like lactoylglutathione lyase family enzyme [Rhizobium tropici]MBB5596738.1 catechol 2,3-dioxygenase-like lactoylglutathione lyase family enzyme [Rhizobium tropici]MBB6495738.1 catechol 2,3-dioxygenase-like lactoylglutathione lyase family enzyme [Rhizobium tropici]NEV15110.1 glyoxalase [Rhizobium tropici]
MQLDHVTLRTADLEATRQFLQDLLGLTIGFRPNFSFPGYWLYCGDEPIVHLTPGGGPTMRRDAEMIDHVGFRLEGYDAFRHKLDETGIPYSTMDLSELGERRLFVRTPGGILLELVFRGDAETN